MFSVALSRYSTVLRALKWSVFSSIIVFVSFKLWGMESFFVEQGRYLISSFGSEKFFLIGIVVLLCPLNWLLEAKKWKTAVQNMSPVSLKTAFKAVITGQAMNLVLPAGIGHCAGRLAYSESVGKESLKQIAPVFLCQTTQMAVTFLVSMFGIFYLKEYFLFEIGWVVGIVLLFLFFLVVYVIANQIKREWLHEIKQGFIQMRQGVVFHMVLFYSALRYMVFSAQFILVFYFLGASEDWVTLAMGISLVFMAKSLMPSIHFLSDLGIREFCALLFLPSLGLAENMVLAASLWVWLVNILFPSIMGSLWLLRVKMEQKWS